MRRARLVLLAGALLYSAWLIAPLLGSGLSVLHSFVSEIGASGQPHAKVFRATDLLAGTCFVIAASLFRGIGRPESRLARIALSGVILLGVATMCDALMPLSCTPTVDAICAAREAAGQVPFTHVGHAVSSGIAGFGGFVAVVAWGLWRRGGLSGRAPSDGAVGTSPAARGAVVAGAGYLIATAWTLAAMLSPALYLGLAQRLQVLTLTLWLVLLALQPLPDRRRRSPSSAVPDTRSPSRPAVAAAERGHPRRRGA